MNPHTITDRNPHYDLAELAKDAMPLDGESYDSVRQIDAENSFFDEVSKLLNDDEFERLEDYCLKATAKERIQAAMLFAQRKGAL